MLVKSRYLIGAALTAAALGISIYLDLIGPTEKPDPLVLNFSRGTTLAAGEHERLLVFTNNQAVEDRLIFNVLGHTGERGDANANLALSKQRAQMVANELKAAGVSEDRIMSVDGVGSADPLPADPDIADSALQRSMARVVVTTLVKK